MSFFAVILHDYNAVLYNQGPVYMRGGGPQVGEVISLGGVTRQSI